MLATESKEEKVIKIYKLFKSVMTANGGHVSIPNNVDPRKTYAWRHLSKFVDRCDELNLDDEIIHNTIYALVRYYKQKKQLHLGMSILNHKDLLGVCAAKLEREARDESGKILMLRENHDFISAEMSRTGLSKQKLLSVKANPLSYTNITRWHQANLLGIGYIALSKACMRTILTIPDIEKSLMPSPKELLKVRLLAQSNEKLMTTAKELLTTDLIME